MYSGPRDRRGFFFLTASVSSARRRTGMPGSLWEKLGELSDLRGAKRWQWYVSCRQPHTAASPRLILLATSNKLFSAASVT